MRSTVDGPTDPPQEGRMDAPALLDRLRGLPTPELEAMFRDLGALHDATDAHRMLVVAVLDDREVGREDGALDTTGWVTWTARVSRAGARALVETARALPERPEIATVALEGRLSGEQLEALVQVATPDTDEQWAGDGPSWSAGSLRAAARNRRAVATEEAVERDRRRELGFRWNEARGELRLWGRIPDVDGALVALALTKGADAAGPDAHGHWDPFPTRCADVLVAALSRDVAEGDEAPRATVVVHTPEAALQLGSGAPGAYVDGARPPSRALVRRRDDGPRQPDPAVQPAPPPGARARLADRRRSPPSGGRRATTSRRPSHRPGATTTPGARGARALPGDDGVTRARAI